MDFSLLLWIAFALLVFWCVGLYNRLMRLRSRAMEVFVALEKHVLVCSDLVSQHVTTSVLLGAAHMGSEWHDVLRAAQNLESLLRTPHPCTLDSSATAPFSDGWMQLQAAWQVVLAQDGDLAGPVVPPELMQAWEASALKVRVVQGGYAQIVERYNAAIAEFPARLVAGLFGFAPAGPFFT